MKTYNEYINESSLSKLWRKYKDCDSGTITAFRGEFSVQENRKRNLSLKGKLLGAGYSVIGIDGYFIENYGTNHENAVKERSFIVFDYKKKETLKKDLMKLGEEFDQDCITFNDVKEGNYYSIGTTHRENAYLKYHEEKKLGKPMFGRDGEMHSRIHGRPFIFECIIEEEETILSYNNYIKSLMTKDARSSGLISQEQNEYD